MRILALDIGEKRIGAAVSDLTATIAQPLKTVIRTSEAEDIQAIVSLVAEYKVSELIVGEPKTLKGLSGKQAESVYQFAAQLRQHLKVPLIYWDERLSSKEARRYLSEKGKKVEKEEVDKVAAALMLQSYLEKRRLKH